MTICSLALFTGLFLGSTYFPSATSCLRSGFRPTGRTTTFCQELDENGSESHGLALRAELTDPTQGQGVSTGVKVQGPFKSGHYRWGVVRFGAN